MKPVMMTVGTMLLCAASASAEDWGTVSGQFVFSGDVPKPVLLHAKGAAIKDAAVCAAADTYSEELVIDPTSKGVANIFVYIVKAPKSIHPDLKVPATKSLIMDQKSCTFIPHAMTVQIGQTVEVLNSDSVPHNTHTNPLKNPQMNVVIAANTAAGKGELVDYKLSETLPSKVNCDFHPWMMSYWLILDHPYAAVSDKDGKFTIPNLPIGEHEFRIWQEKTGYINRKFMVTVKPGDNPLSTMELVLDGEKLKQK